MFSDFYSHCRPLHDQNKYNFATSFCGTNICNKRELVFKVGKQVKLVCSLQILGLVFLRYLKLFFWIFSYSLHYTQIIYWYNWYICCINLCVIFSYVSLKISFLESNIFDLSQISTCGCSTQRSPASNVAIAGKMVSNTYL